jgi:preprotein translocase subunit Sss1
MRVLGRLEEGQERLRADFTDEKEHSAESRGRMHTKLEKIEEDVGIVGQVAAQARDKAEKVDKVVTEDVKPATDEYKRLRRAGLGLIGIVGFLGTALGITVANFGDAAVQAIRHWLKIT